MNPKEQVTSREFLTAEDLQAIFKISRSSSYSMMNAKDFPAIRINRRSLRVQRESLYAWIEAQEAKGVR